MCPKDKIRLDLFKDENFPQQLVILSCPVCHGFWLNRGEFTEYQQIRSDRTKQSKSDEEFEKQVDAILSKDPDKTNDTLGNLGEFLMSPAPSQAIPNFTNANNVSGIILQVIVSILMAILRR